MLTGIASTEISRHKCLIYEGDPSEQLPVIVPFLVEGLRDNLRCLYLGSPKAVSMMRSALAGRSVDTEQEMRRGALILSSEKDHLKDGAFEPRVMVALLVKAVDDAVRDGFGGLCASGDMRWELGADKNFERLLEYEALLEEVFQKKPLRGICQYHRDIIPAKAVQDALVTHRSAYIGDGLNRENLFYMPPQMVLGDLDASRDKQGEWMCQQIIRIMNAERKRDEALAALAEANRNLERRVQERTAQLEATNKELEAFSYSVSHDLRAPLRGIDGFSRILQEDHSDKLGDAGRDAVQRVRAATHKMDELIESMLKLSRLSRQEMKHETVDLTRLAREIEQELRKLQPERRVDVVVAEALSCAGDRALLLSALQNLIGNAWKFTAKRENARIEIGTAGEEEGRTVFFVSDNGPGFDMKYAGKLFGAFQRLHSPEEFPGTGVGLATVQRIVRRHGGRTWAEAAPNEGATFFFTLPKP